MKKKSVTKIFSVGWEIDAIQCIVNITNYIQLSIIESGLTDLLQIFF